MKMLNNKVTLSLVIVLVGSALISTPMVRYATGEEDEARPPLLLLRAGGMAVDVNTEEIIHVVQFIVCAVLEPKTDNFTFISLFVVKGVVRIGPFDCNITEGRGVIVIQRHVLMLFCNGTTPEGEDFTYKLFGRITRTPKGLRPIMLIGMLNTNDGLRYVLLLLGKPRLFLQK